MPSQPPKPCRKAGCRKLTRRSDGYCEAHAKHDWKEADKHRKTAPERGYDWKWRKVRNSKLSANQLCERCSGVRVARIVHHIDENPKNNEWDNLLSVCEQCHQELHRKD